MADTVDSNNRVVYVIAGPTAVGKTAIAIALAKRLGTEIVSADSRQCYREMTIGTAKPSVEELTEVKHHFIDEFPVTKSLTAADYETLALGYLNDIFKTNNTAVVCGGTGLYIKALCDGLDEMPAMDEQIVAEVNEQYQLNGLHWLQRAILEEDPIFHQQGEMQNPARLIRALIFKRSTDESIIDFRTGARKPRNFKTVKIALELPREELYHRINRRVDKMMQEGLLEEVKALYPLKQLKNLQTVGYTELFDHLDGKMTLEESVEKIKQHTRNYAKRQFTWFKKDKAFHWFHPTEKDLVEKIISLSATI
ncbi:MAG: tRNA (adenosine(37)-N6)-dimethylallyltransferase MiaA [Sphingobacteriales bacterium]|nr:MAG: tRNA (adenosine(37)-N6)-dimethylallyltransferase MiaA [Sphingobacteriales bacterium]